MLSTAYNPMGVPSNVSPSSSSVGGDNAPFDQGTDTLWVFLLELLSAPQQYGHVICWTDYSQAEFKLYKPADVASLWGRRKNRPAMNYDKLSRSLRYYYKKNILRKVPGRKYVYQFCRLDQLLASLNPLNSPIATAYCQIFSQHLAASMYSNQGQQQHQALQQMNSQPVAYGQAQQVLPLRQANSLPGTTVFNHPGLNSVQQQQSAFPMMQTNTPVSFKSQLPQDSLVTAGFRSRPVPNSAVKQPLTPTDDEASSSGEEDDVDVEDRFDANHPALHVSPQTAFAQYAAIDGNSQPESIPPRHHTPPSSQITPSASGSEGRTPSIYSSSGEPPAKQAALESSSISSTSTSSPVPKMISALNRPEQIAVPTASAPQPQNSTTSHIADRRALKRKPEPLKFTTNSSAFSAANLATSAVPSAIQEADNRLQQQFAFLNTLNSLQSALSPFTAKTFSLFNPLSASLATPQTTDWFKLPSPRADAPQAQPVSTFTFPPPLVAQLAPLGIPAPLPSPMASIATPLLQCDSATAQLAASAFNFSLCPPSANLHSLLTAAHLAASTFAASNPPSASSTSSFTPTYASSSSSSSSSLAGSNN